MEELINLNVDFVSETQAEIVNGTAQTGDMLCWIMLIVLAALCVTGIVLFNKFKTRLITEQGSDISYDTNANLSLNNKLFNTRSLKWISLAVAIVSALAIATTLITKTAFAGNTEQALVPNANTITAVVHDDGTFSFSECYLTNISENDNYFVTSSSLTVNDEAKTVEAINSSKLTITGFEGVVYSAKPDGSIYNVENISSLAKYESTKLGFKLENLDAKSAYALCGKSVYTIALTHSKSYNVKYEKGEAPATITGAVPVDATSHKPNDNVTVKDKNTLECEGYDFCGWLDSDGNTYSITKNKGVVNTQLLWSPVPLRTDSALCWANNSNRWLQYNRTTEIGILFSRAF